MHRVETAISLNPKRVRQITSTLLNRGASFWSIVLLSVAVKLLATTIAATLLIGIDPRLPAAIAAVIGVIGALIGPSRFRPLMQSR